jgi:hypothetical protein
VGTLPLQHPNWSKRSVPKAVEVFMEKWEELLKNPEFSHFINTHQGAASRIMTASQKLAENTDALEALMKLLPALDQQVVNVFFSYKTEDEAAARAMPEQSLI